MEGIMKKEYNGEYSPALVAAFYLKSFNYIILEMIHG